MDSSINKCLSLINGGFIDVNLFRVGEFLRAARAHGHEREVVVLGSAGGERGQFAHDAVDKLFHRGRTFSDQSLEPVYGEFFVGKVSRLGHTVDVEDCEVAGAECYLDRLERGVFENP